MDQRADIYAWGVVAYELLAGAHPFAARTTARQVMSAHLTERPVPLAARASVVPAPLADLVDRSLAKEREHRPQSAAELLRVLDGLAYPGAAPADSSPVRRRVRVMIVGCALAIALALGLMLARRGASPFHATASPGPTAPRSLAVLPFTSPDRDSANAYFGAGMAEELTTAFARVPGLRVASRGSASRLQDAGTTEAEIARELGVQTILEGSHPPGRFAARARQPERAARAPARFDPVGCAPGVGIRAEGPMAMGGVRAPVPGGVGAGRRRRDHPPLVWRAVVRDGQDG